MALNHVEDAGRVLVSLPGCLSSVFYISGGVILSGNSEIGIVASGMSRGDLYRHFQNMLDQGGDLVCL